MTSEMYRLEQAARMAMVHHVPGADVTRGPWRGVAAAAAVVFVASAAAVAAISM